MDDPYQSWSLRQNLNYSPGGIGLLSSVLFIVDGVVEKDVDERDVVAKVVGTKISIQDTITFIK